MVRIVLPQPFVSAPFTVGGAEAAGLGRGRLAGPDLVVPTRGVRTTTAYEALGRDRREAAFARARAFTLALPGDSAFSHVTAAQLWGLPLPTSLEADPTLHSMRPTTTDRVRRAGCVGHRGLERRDVVPLRGVRVTSLCDTWVDLGEIARLGVGFDELVTAGDQVATRLGGVEPLLEVLGRRVRPRGKRVLVASLDLVRWPVRSPMETRARLTFVRAGLPEPGVNVAMRDADGEWLMEVDFVWEEARVIGEYQGAVHAPIDRRSLDASRRRLAEDGGWTVVEIFKEDLRPTPRGWSFLHGLAKALRVDEADLQDPWALVAAPPYRRVG